MSLPAPSVAFEPIEPGERTRRQVAVRLLPFLFVLYVANYIDRTSVAFAALGISGDLGLSDRTLGLAAGIFFVSYIALRLVLGSAEAGFFPGVIVYLSRWFSRTERARAVAYFMAAIPFSQAIASALAGWIVGHAFASI